MKQESNNALDALIKALHNADPSLDYVELADVIWLAMSMPTTEGKPPDDAHKLWAPGERSRPYEGSHPGAPTPSAPRPPAERRRHRPVATHAGFAAPGGMTEAPDVIAAPSASALLNRLHIARALKPFKRSHPSKHIQEFDVETTIDLYADTGFLYPVMRPGTENWFDVALVVDESMSMIVWDETIEELVKVFDRQGAFRDVHRWTLREENGLATVRNEAGLPAGPHRLVDPGGRRLVILISDCVSALWYRPRIWQTLQRWGKITPVAIVQMLPRRAWATTALGTVNVPVWSTRPGVPNEQLYARLPFWADAPKKDLEPIPIPVIGLDPEAILTWARVTMGEGPVKTRAVVKTDVRGMLKADPTAPEPSAAERLDAFRASVPAQTWRLARYLSVMPLRMPVMRLVQEALLPDTGHAELAEFMVSGLIRHTGGKQRVLDGSNLEFEFVDGVREALNQTLGQSQMLEVYRAIARYLERTSGRAPDFAALVLGQDIDESSVPESLRDFVTVGRGVIRRVGLADNIAPIYAATGMTEQARTESAIEMDHNEGDVEPFEPAGYRRLEPIDPRDAFTVILSGDSSTYSAAASQAAFLLIARAGVLGRSGSLFDTSAIRDFGIPDFTGLQRTRRLTADQATKQLGLTKHELSTEYSSEKLQEVLNKLVRRIYDKPSFETVAALFEGALASSHPLVRVAAAAGAVETTRTRKSVLGVLEQGVGSDDPLTARVAQVVLGNIDNQHPLLAERVIEQPVSRKRRRSSSTSVLTHGIFAAQSAWYKPGGAFYEALSQKRPDLHLHDKSFAWTGAFSDTAPRHGARLLKQWLHDQGIVAPDFFAQGEGGSVAHLATREGVEFDRLVLMSWPVDKKWFPDFSMVQRIIDVRVRLGLVTLAALKKERFRTQAFPIERHRHGWFDDISVINPSYWDDHGLWDVL